MYIKQISLTNFRNYENEKINLEKRCKHYIWYECTR